MAVLPLNPSDVVDRVLTRFGLTYDSSMVISIDAGGQTFLPVDTPIIAGELLSSYVELGQPATRQQISQLADATACPPDKKALEGWPTTWRPTRPRCSTVGSRSWTCSSASRPVSWRSPPSCSSSAPSHHGSTRSPPRRSGALTT